MNSKTDISSKFRPVVVQLGVLTPEVYRMAREILARQNPLNGETQTDPVKALKDLEITPLGDHSFGLCLPRSCSEKFIEQHMLPKILPRHYYTGIEQNLGKLKLEKLERLKDLKGLTQKEKGEKGDFDFSPVTAIVVEAVEYGWGEGLSGRSGFFPWLGFLFV